MKKLCFKNDCDKLKKATQDNPTMITDLINLEAKTSEPIEHGIYKTSGSVTTQIAIAGQNGSVEFPNITTGKYEVVAHTHNSPANSTYSIFSWEDLESVYNMIKADKINTSKFVSFFQLQMEHAMPLLFLILENLKRHLLKKVTLNFHWQQTLKKK